MKHTETEIVEIAKKTMTDIEWSYNQSEKTGAVFVSYEKQIKELDRIHKNGFLPKQITYEQAKNKIKSYWIIDFGFDIESEITNNRMIIKIDDLTGEPYQIRHKQAFFNIVKDEDGKYYTEFLYYS